MKKIILGLLLLVSSTLFSQTSYRALMFQHAYKNEITDKYVWEKSQNVNLIVTINKSVVTIENEANTKLTCYEVYSEERDVDDDGDSYTLKIWRAKDKEGLKCLFSMMIYDSPNVTYNVYSILYSDIAFRYYVKRTSIQ